MLKSEKQSFVSELETVYKESSSLVVTHYHGLTVSQLTDLRRSLRKNNAKFRIVKNTLSKIAANNSQLGQVVDLFSGPTAIAYSEDPIAAAKGVVEFAKNNQQLKIVGGVVDGKLVSVSEIDRLAKLPSLDELRGQLVGILQAPASKIIGVLEAPATKLARVFKSYSNK
jgi:large subunit ribosomal protein L10